MCLHPWNKAGAAEEFTALRELISILQESEAYRKYCGEHNSNIGEKKKKVCFWIYSHLVWANQQNPKWEGEEDRMQN